MKASVMAAATPHHNPLDVPSARTHNRRHFPFRSPSARSPSRSPLSASACFVRSVPFGTVEEPLMEAEMSPFTRREFVKAGAAGAAGIALGGGRALSAMQAAVPGQPRIAVIGAGLAGLTAAHTLRQLGHRNVTVFEKEPGRAATSSRITVSEHPWRWGRCSQRAVCARSGERAVRTGSGQHHFEMTRASLWRDDAVPSVRSCRRAA